MIFVKAFLFFSTKLPGKLQKGVRNSRQLSTLKIRPAKYVARILHIFAEYYNVLVMLKNLRLTGGSYRVPQIDTGRIVLGVDIFSVRVCFGCGSSCWGRIGCCSKAILIMKCYK